MTLMFPFCVRRVRHAANRFTPMLAVPAVVIGTLVRKPA